MVIERRKGEIWFKRAITVWMLASFLFVVGGYKQNQNRAKEGQEAHDAICVFKKDLDRRNRESQRLLDEHPGDIFGIPRQVIIDSVAARSETIRSLAAVKCEGEE